ncbi:competence protein CoiA [Lentibacillus sediminis]|uniref:competence protein CoiA n=1 Tax=Lentibacillus sediminis TaxID=1940529 RepID=UPI00130406BB|nr:competence protein CoiA family protein [Lentibacillus sediminis]
MLQAKTKEGTLFTPATRKREELGRLRGREFYCPSCGQQVMMKAGRLTTPHFAHKSAGVCPSSEGGEGAYHAQGKLFLYKWLTHQGLDAELEAYLPDISQRPDILLRLNGRRIAIEYQCARIPNELVNRRNQGYQEAGITPIWILGENRLTRKSSRHIKLDRSLLPYIHSYSADYPLTMYFFCAYTLKMITFRNIIPTGSNQAFGTLAVRRLDKITIKDLLLASRSFPEQDVFQHWQKEKHKFRMKPINQLHGKALEWQQWIYLKGQHPEQLPSAVHLPVASGIWMKRPPWEWQSRLLLERLDPLLPGATITVRACENYLKRYRYQPSFYPLIKSPGNPAAEYLQVLTQLGIFESLDEHTFRKLTSISFYQTIDEAIQGDTVAMNQLIAPASRQIAGMNEG